ncbi:MAG: ABC transporter permease [Blastocatellia bacterium]|nr:ABC transporter permease [Blastocatellia bacterium]
MQTLLQDLRYGARMLLKKPGFTAVAVLTLALGIGANSAIFSVVNAVLLRPLPYPDSERIVRLWQTLPAHGLERLSLSAPEFVDYRDRSRSFSSLAVYASQGLNLTGAGEAERVTCTYVTRGFFSVLDVRPFRGRNFYVEEDAPDNDLVVILSHALWQNRFGGDESILGQAVTLNGRSHTVIGIMPAAFQFPNQDTEIWKPMAFSADDYSEDSRGSHYLRAVARLKPGVSLEQARSEVASIARQLQHEHPTNYEEGSGWSAGAASLHEEAVGDVRLTLLVLLGAVGFVLLIACANVANLLLARATSRQRELAIRSALGAGRWRIVRQLMTESLTLALLGGCLGILLALWGNDMLRALSPADFPRLDEIGVDARLIAFTFLVSLLTSLLFGVVPALQTSKLNLSDSLKESGNTSTDTRSRHRLRGLLVAGEVALALVLLIGAGLLIKSLYKLQQVELGFNPSNLLTMRLDLPRAKYGEPVRQRAFFEQLIDRVESLPNVKSVGIVNYLPLSGSGNQRNAAVEGKPENPINIEFRIVSPAYFRTMGIGLSEGRLFDERDREDAPYVAVVNETFTRIFLPDENPLGKRIKYGGAGSPFKWLTVVGVVKDLKHNDVDAEVKPEIYISYLQPPLPNWNTQNMFLAVRAESEAQNLIPVMRDIVRSIDSDQPIYSIATMQELIARSTAARRFNMLLMAIFAALAVLLAMVGIYSVMSYSITQRTREIGIRLALGARSRDILRLVLRRGMVLAVTGLVAGMLAALWLTPLMAGLLYEVSATDPLTFVMVALLLFVVALLACWIPARRATKVDPMTALRYE